jgi:pimeloyl-ACP methyl ester carboxylesterase
MDVRSRNGVRASGGPGGPVVLPAHGFGCGRNMWPLLMPTLERTFISALEETTQAITA